MSKKGKFGKLPPRYSFALNPYVDERFSRCPRCQGAMNLRKFALLIHVEGADLMTLGKTCRYCPRCELIIAHQIEIEAELTHRFEETTPEVIGNEYFIFGTVDLKTWRVGLRGNVTMEDARNHAADFREYLKLDPTRAGWKPNR